MCGCCVCLCVVCPGVLRVRLLWRGGIVIGLQWIGVVVVVWLCRWGVCGLMCERMWFGCLVWCALLGLLLCGWPTVCVCVCVWERVCVCVHV